MKVVVASFDEVPSFKGASAHILSGLRRAAIEHEVILVTLGDNPLPRFGGLRHLPLPIREPNHLRRALTFQREVFRILCRERPDLAHVRSPWEGIAAIEAGTPMLYEINALPSLELPYRFRSIPEGALERIRAMENRCIAGARIIITPSELIRRRLSIGGGANRPAPCMHFPNGYDPVAESVRPAPLPAPGEPVRLVYLGTLSPWQGINWSLRAFREAGPAVSLDIHSPTGGVQRAYVERRIKRFGLGDSVRLHPPLDRAGLARELPRYHLGFAPLLKTTRNVTQGGFPIKLLDYLSHGLPVLTSDLRINRQIVSPECAILHQPNSRPELIAAIRSLAGEPSRIEKLREGIAARLREHWTWDEYADALNELYVTLAESSFRPSRPSAAARSPS